MKTLILLLLFIQLSACVTMNIRRDESAGATSPPKTYAIHSFLWAVVPGRQLPSEKDLCPQSRIADIDLRMSPLDVLISSATLGVYVPHRVTVSCSQF